jgi:hypothetical protein
MPWSADIDSMIVEPAWCYIESTMAAARFKSRTAAILAALYLLPGAWIIGSTCTCRSIFCDLPAIVYSALPVPFLKVFYMVGAAMQGVSWWEAPWPMPGAILAALSLACNAATIYFVVLGIQSMFRRKRETA